MMNGRIPKMGPCRNLLRTGDYSPLTVRCFLAGKPQAFPGSLIDILILLGGLSCHDFYLSFLIRLREYLNSVGIVNIFAGSDSLCLSAILLSPLMNEHAMQISKGVCSF